MSIPSQKGHGELYTSEDCVTDSWALDWNDKILVLNPEHMLPNYRTPAFQLWRGDGGFGCSPNAIGKAVYAVCLADEERSRWDRADFIGVLKPELAEQAVGTAQRTMSDIIAR